MKYASYCHRKTSLFNRKVSNTKGLATPKDLLFLLQELFTFEDHATNCSIFCLFLTDKICLINQLAIRASVTKLGDFCGFGQLPEAYGKTGG